MTTDSHSAAEFAVTIPAVFVKGMLSGVTGRGESPAIFLRDAQIPAQRLEQTDARVTLEQYLALFRSLNVRRDDAMLGFLSRKFRRGSLGIIVRAGVSAPNLQLAMRRMARAFNLLQDDLVLRVVHEDRRTGLTLHFHNPEASWPNFLHEVLLRVYWRFLLWLSGEQLRVSRFDFSYSAPSYAKEYRPMFPGQLRFGRARSALWIESALLDAATRQSEDSVPRFLRESQAYVVYQKSWEETTATRVRSLLQAAQLNWPELGACAKKLHVSSATLQRRLAAEKTSFQTIKDELRRDMAIEKLHSSGMSLERLGAELGFSSRDAFHHAFKKWTGSTPAAYRTQGLAG